MPIPAGYDIGLQHPSVNGGATVGLMLDERIDHAFTEQIAVVAHVDTTTDGSTSVASFGLGVCTFEARIPLHADIRTRSHRPATQSPAALRALLLQFAAITDGATILHYAAGSRYISFSDAVRFLSGPAVDGSIAVVTMIDLGAA